MQLALPRPGLPVVSDFISAWHQVCVLKLLYGTEEQLLKRIKWPEIKQGRKQLPQQAGNESSCHPGFIRCGPGDSFSSEVSDIQSPSLRVKGYRMRSNLFFTGHHFLAFFFFLARNYG